MRKSDFLTQGVQINSAYESPQVDVFALRSEGLLCQSFGEPGAPGKDPSVENEWDF